MDNMGEVKHSESRWDSFNGQQLVPQMKSQQLTFLFFSLFFNFFIVYFVFVLIAFCLVFLVKCFENVVL